MFGAGGDGLDRAWVGECEGYLNLPHPVRNHVTGQALPKPREFREKATIVGIQSKWHDLDAFNQIRRIRPGDNLALRFFGAAQNTHLYAVARPEWNNLRRLGCGC